jgi:hypothetical protein
MIPESQHPKTLLVKPVGSPCVLVDLFRVLSAIQLDDQPSLEAHEVSNIGSDGRLSAKLAAIHLTLP